MGVTFPRRGSSTFAPDPSERKPDTQAEEGKGLEVIWDLCGVSFGRNFFEYFVGMREGEGSVVEGAQRGVVLVDNEQRKGWVLRGMERKPPVGKVRVDVRGEGERGW